MASIRKTKRTWRGIPAGKRKPFTKVYKEQSRRTRAGRKAKKNPVTIRGWVRAKAVKIVRDKKGRAVSVKIKT